MDISYIINELGEEREHYFNAITPPIMQTSNFAFNTVNDMRGLFKDEYSGYIYSRGRNPTVDILRTKLAALDGAEDCLVFNSGDAAIFASVLANVKSGDHIISVREPYSWAKKTFTQILPRFNVNTTFIDGREPENFVKARQDNTTIIYLESPNSWGYELQDLATVAAFAKQHGIITICDNSYCSPVYQQPISMGIDLVLQSATKYIGGHSDTVGGVLSGSRAMIERIFNNEYNNIGSGIQPFNAWLLLRGLRTLPMRLERISKTTRAIIDYLKQQPLVEEVIFPLDPSFPQYELAKKQMKGGCGLLTFVVKATKIEELEMFCESLRHIRMAVSWGGHESLVIPACGGILREQFDPGNRQHRMIRLYTGLEDAPYLVDDLEQAFGKIKNA